MKYKLIRMKAAELKSHHLLKDDEIEFQSDYDLFDLMNTLKVGESFSFMTNPKIPGALARLIVTSHVIQLYPMTNDSFGFNTETGSKYIVKKLI